MAVIAYPTGLSMIFPIVYAKLRAYCSLWGKRPSANVEKRFITLLTVSC